MIDMDDLMGDPDFFQEIIVYRRQQNISDGGVVFGDPVQILPSPFGSIQSGANPELLRGTDYAVSSDMITVYTDFLLLESGTTSGQRQNATGTASTDAYGNQILPLGAGAFQADIVFWHGDPYEVFQVQDWADYGAGWIEAVCVKVSSAQAGLS